MAGEAQADATGHEKAGDIAVGAVGVAANEDGAVGRFDLMLGAVVLDKFDLCHENFSPLSL